MNEILPADVTGRQEHLQNLAMFCRRLRAALDGMGLAEGQAADVLRTRVSAECVQCGIQVSGQELLALSEPPSAALGTARIGRMRLGHCALQGCSSRYCRLAFQPHPSIHWPELLKALEREEPPSAPASVAASRLAPLLWLGRQRRIWIVVLVVVLLALARQWYLGGRIPWLREPEHFRVDPSPVPELR